MLNTLSAAQRERYRQELQRLLAGARDDIASDAAGQSLGARASLTFEAVLLKAAHGAVLLALRLSHWAAEVRPRRLPK